MNVAQPVLELIRLRYPPDALLASGYHEAVEVFRAPGLARESEGAFFQGTVDKLHGAEHTQRRRTLNPAFNRYALETYRREMLIPTFERALVDVHAGVVPGERPRADLARLAERIFLQFAAALVGIENTTDPERSEVLYRFYRIFSAAVGYKHARVQDDSVFTEARQALREFEERFLLPSLRSHELRKDESLMTLFANRADPAWNDREQLVREAAFFVIASVDTSANFLVHLMAELWEWFDLHPEDIPLRADPSFLGAAIDEAARLHPNLPDSARVAAEDVELASGVRVRKGQHVVINKYDANHDTSVFGADAEWFNPRRTVPPGVPRYGIAFGAGSHKCIGLPVVLGHDLATGSHAQLVTRLFDAGVERDPEGAPAKAATYIDRYESFPVVFRRRGDRARYPPRPMMTGYQSIVDGILVAAERGR